MKLEKISAFVAHSFDEKDKPLIRKFTDYFDSISESSIPFEWVHAEKAESSVLSDKVLERMEIANTFIGICTSKERVIVNESLPRSFFNNQKEILKKNDYLWKTSDWIIQEIGCAFGRRMKIILFIEEGLRPPGGLQGNLKYIPFSRQNLELAFQKFIEMINNIVPKTLQESNEVEDQKSKTVSQIESNDQDKTNKTPDLEINEAWTDKEFSNALFYSILKRDDEKEKEIFDSYLTKFGKSYTDASLVIEARRLYFKHIINNENVINKLRDLLGKNPDNSEINRMIGKIYKSFEQYELAFKHSLIAYKKSLMTQDLSLKKNSL